MKQGKKRKKHIGDSELNDKKIKKWNSKVRKIVCISLWLEWSWLQWCKLNFGDMFLHVLLCNSTMVFQTSHTQFYILLSKFLTSSKLLSKLKVINLWGNFTGQYFKNFLLRFQKSFKLHSTLLLTFERECTKLFRVYHNSHTLA